MNFISLVESCAWFTKFMEKSLSRPHLNVSFSLCCLLGESRLVSTYELIISYSYFSSNLALTDNFILPPSDENLLAIQQIPSRGGTFLYINYFFKTRYKKIVEYIYVKYLYRNPLLLPDFEKPEDKL